MNSSTQKTLLIGVGLIAAYYFYKQTAVAPGSAETPSELLASTNSTVAGQLAAMFPGT